MDYFHQFICYGFLVDFSGRRRVLNSTALMTWPHSTTVIWAMWIWIERLCVRVRRRNITYAVALNSCKSGHATGSTRKCPSWMQTTLAFTWIYLAFRQARCEVVPIHGHVLRPIVHIRATIPAVSANGFQWSMFIYNDVYSSRDNVKAFTQ